MISGVNVQLKVAGAKILDEDLIGGWYNELTSPFTECVCVCVRACARAFVCVCVHACLRACVYGVYACFPLEMLARNDKYQTESNVDLFTEHVFTQL